MTESLQNLMAVLGDLTPEQAEAVSKVLLSKLSPTALKKHEQETKVAAAEISEKLTESKKAFVNDICELIEGNVEAPELCTVSLVIDEKGHISVRTYKSGEVKGAKTSVSGVGNHTAIPEVGTVALRTFKGQQHKLLVRGEGDFLLDDKIECKSSNQAYQLTTGSKVPMDARKWWFVQGTLVPPVK